MIPVADLHLAFWGKARPAAGPPSPQYHPVAYHLLDVAAAMEAILEVRPVALQRAARLLRLSPGESRRVLVTLAALHDLGKFASAFQAQVPDPWPEEVLGLRHATLVFPGRHTEDGHALRVETLGGSVAERLWPGALESLDALAPAIFGHPGRPASGRDRVPCRRGDKPLSSREKIGPRQCSPQARRSRRGRHTAEPRRDLLHGGASRRISRRTSSGPSGPL